MKETLMKIGLSENESEIYLALLKLGESSVYHIVEKTGINRTNIYDCLSRLIDKGLVTYIIKNKKKYFNSVRPKRIRDYLNEKENQITLEMQAIEKIIPEMELIVHDKSNEKVEVYEGKKGIKDVLELILDSRKDVNSIGSRGNMSILGAYMKHYVKRMSKLKIKARIIFADDKSKEQFRYDFAEVRFLPKQYSISTETMIFGDNVVIFVFGEYTKSILIQSKIVSDSYRKNFELLWKIAKK